MEAQKRLTLKGNIVISVGFFGHSDEDEDLTEVAKEMPDDMHKSKSIWSIRFSCLMSASILQTTADPRLSMPKLPVSLFIIFKSKEVHRNDDRSCVLY